MSESFSETIPAQNTLKTLANTILHVNRAYQEALSEKIESLQKKLKYNIFCQNQLNQKISKSSTLAINKNFNSPKESCGLFAENEEEINKIKDSYFKDRFGSEPSDNIDTIAKRKYRYYSYAPMNSNEWTLSYRKKLKTAVFNDCLRLLKAPFLNKIKLLHEKINKLKQYGDLEFENYEQYMSLRRLLKQAKISVKKIDSMQENDVLSQVDVEKIDWMKISKIDLDSNFSSKDCQLVWINICHPSINQTKWTQAENERLIELARVYGEKNWKQISIDLNTNRSPYLCMKRYHEKTADKYCKRDWTEEETLELNSLADSLRVGLFVPYNYICYLIGTRDRNTVYNRHLKTDTNLNHGKWLPHEEKSFHEAIQFFDFKSNRYNWQAISEYVGTRSALQCKDRFDLKYCNPDKYINWTWEDDKNLLESYREYGAQWVKIAKEVFPNRNNHSCLFRFNKLMHWKRQNVWFESQPDEIKEFILFIFKKKRKKVSDSDRVYTSYGDLVPTIPKFGSGLHNLTYIINQIYEKRPLIDQFIHKKRQGQLSLTLLDQIGISTPVLNALMDKYKNQYLKESNETKTQRAPKVLREPKPKKLKLPKERKIVKIKRLVPKTKTCTNNQENCLTNPKKQRKTISSLLQMNDKPTIRSLSQNYFTNNSLRSSKIKKAKLNLESSRKRILVKDALMQKYFNNSTSNFDEFFTKNFKVKTKKLTINKIFENIEENNKIETNLAINNTTMTNNDETISFVVEHIEDSSTKLCTNSNENLNQTQNQIAEENIQSSLTITDKISPVQESATCLSKPNAVETQKEAINTNENIFIVNLNDIEDGTKISCFKEQFKELKYTYSMKKDSASNYLQKHTIINFNGKLVAILYVKKLIKNESLTVDKIKSIEKALSKIR